MKLICFILFCFSTCFAHEKSSEYTSLEKVLPFDGFGWFGGDNQQLLSQFIQQRHVKVIVELGSFLGCSTRFMAKLLPPGGVIYAVDHWLGNQEHQNPARTDVYHKLPTLYQQFLSNVIHEGLCDKIIPMRMSSLEAAKVIRVKPDLVYVDASHDFESVLKDLEAWFPFVKGHGILCGDDWIWGEDLPVRRAVIHFAAQHHLKYRNYGNFWVLVE